MSTKKTTPAKKRAPGRPTRRTPAVVAKILAGLSKGTPLTVICKAAGMPAPRTVKDWQVQDDALREELVAARTLGEDVLLHNCRRVAADKKIPVDRAKLIIETELKLAAKFNPQRLGDKQQIEHSGSIGLAGRLAAARAKRTGGDE